VKGNDYVYAYRVRFTEPHRKVRFGMMLKTVSGYELGGAATHPQDDGIEYVAPGSMVHVEFPFRCLLSPGVYFLNAGVLAAVDGEEAYLHRLIDVAMFRVQPEPDLLTTAVVDFCVAPRVSVEKQAASA